MPSELVIRQARSEDRPVMEKICAQTWEWGDYIAEVWEEWLADESGPLIVGEIDGRVVALSKITKLGADQAWLEGMRVDPQFRQRGIAREFLEYGLAYAQQQGARVVRLSTGDFNTTVHHMMARAGMQRVGACAFWAAAPLQEAPGPFFLTPGEADQVLAFLEQSTVLAETGRLYYEGWAWQELSAERVTQFLEQEQIVAERTADSQIASLALVTLPRKQDPVWIGFADGQPGAVTRLALAIRALAAQHNRPGPEAVEAALPEIAWLRAAFQAAGYSVGELQGELWVFERRFAPPDGEYQDGPPHA